MGNQWLFESDGIDTANTRTFSQHLTYTELLRPDNATKRLQHLHSRNLKSSFHLKGGDTKIKWIWE